MYKIAIIIFLAFLTTWVSFSIVEQYSTDTHLGKENKFYSQKIESGKTILIGSSHMGSLNVTITNDVLKKNGFDDEVYNLSYNGDNPSRREKVIDDIIQLNPKLIIYGVSFRDFTENTNENPFPDPQFIIHEFHKQIDPETQFVNPKFTTMSNIREVLNQINLGTKSPYTIIENTPFMKYHYETQMTIMDENQLNLHENSEAKSIRLNDFGHNSEAKKLSKMIQKIKDNNIDFVLLITPLHSSYLDDIPENERIKFNELVSNISSLNQIKIIDYQNRYSELNVWANPSHVSVSKNSTVYAEDIARIIMDGVKK